MSPVQGRLRPLLDRLLIAVFLVALAAPTLDQLLRPAEARGPLATERREPAPLPELPASLQELGRWPRAFEDWYLDRFGLRDWFLRQAGWLRLSVFGQSPTTTVDIGRDGWMFWTGDSSMHAFRGRLPLDEAQLIDWQLMLSNHSKVCAELGITCLYVCGPNKETIYPERVPAWWTKLGPTRLEQVQDWLHVHDDGRARMLDLRPALLLAKAEDVPGDHVYYQYGTHWNGRGCYVAYREILAALQDRFPAAAPLPPGGFQQSDGPGYGDSWASAMYLGDLLPQRQIMFQGAGLAEQQVDDRGEVISIVKGNNPSGPRVVLFGDSFAQSITHLLPQQFSRMVFNTNLKLDEALIAREMPDVVLELFVERTLVHLDPRALMIGNAELGRLCFERARDRVFELTAGNAASALQPVGAARIETSGELVTLHLGDAGAHVALPPLAAEVDSDLLVHVELDSSVATKVRVSAVYTGSGCAPDASSEVEKGANSLWLRVPYRRGVSQLVLHTGHPGQFVLRVLEVRQAPR